MKRPPDEEVQREAVRILIAVRACIAPMRERWLDDLIWRVQEASPADGLSMLRSQARSIFGTMGSLGDMAPREADRLLTELYELAFTNVEW